METLTGTVERITYYNEENGYGVVKVLPEGAARWDAAASDGTVAVVGVMPELSVGESVQFTGQWVSDPRWGLQFKVETVKPILPSSLHGIKRYLSSGLVKGIGPRTAEKIVDHFGLETLDVLEREPRRLTEVLSPKLADKLARAWVENRTVRQTMIFLQGYGVSSRIAMRIYEKYGDETIAKVQEDVYRLADEVYGIGFIKADAIARNMGIQPDAPTRLRAGLHYTLNKLASEGHTYAPREVLINTAAELLRVKDKAGLDAVLVEELSTGALVADHLIKAGEPVEAIYLPMYYHCEQGAAQRLRTIARAASALLERDRDWDAILAQVVRQNAVTLTEQQWEAVRAALTHKVSVLTGGPGTGKTTTLRMVIQALEAGECRYVLASPTGRAAKRLSEATERPASTIHRLLGYSPGHGYTFDEDYPLDADMVVVDEASMIDLPLFYHLLKALRPRTCLMLVGDVDQLPSVGAGNVLHDVIDSGLAHVTRLETIFRQSEDSLIVVNAHRVNRGEMPDTSNHSNDFFMFHEGDPAKVAELVVDIVKNRLPQKFGYDPIEDVQVIAPMYRGPVGVHALNTALQAALNGDRRRAEKQLGARVFRVGDKVIQTRNDYNKEVFNGDIGRIHGIDFSENLLEVVIDGRFLTYDWSEADDLVHAYCISTHRSQGSEYPVVVMPLLTQHYMMLQRNLLYTAITRAKKMVVLVGTHKAIYLAVNNNKVAERYSGLLARLQR